MKSQRMKGQETKRSKERCQERASLGTRFLVMGSLNYDYIYSLDHIVEPGETIASVKLDKARPAEEKALTRLQPLQKLVPRCILQVW